MTKSTIMGAMQVSRGSKMSGSRRSVALVTCCAVLLATAGCSKKNGSYGAASEAELKGTLRTNLDSPVPTKAQLERKERAHQAITGMSLPWLDSLPVVEDEKSVKPRSQSEVVGRALATEFCAVRGEGREQKLPLDLVERFGIRPALSPKERAFLDNAKPTDQDYVNFAWGYEHAHVLLWALGYLPALNAPNVIADVAKEAALIREKGPSGFSAGAHLRPLSEILDQADLYYRIHWALLDLRLKGKHSERADEEIVMERHRALNWLIRYMNQEWDDVTTDT